MVTKERVEAVLQQLRPLLQADGGDMELLAIEENSIRIRLTGACMPVPAPISLDERLRELESSLIMWALIASNGNKSRAAELLQIKRSTLGDRIRHCGLDRLAIQSSHTLSVVSAA